MVVATQTSFLNYITITCYLLHGLHFATEYWANICKSILNRAMHSLVTGVHIYMVMSWFFLVDHISVFFSFMNHISFFICMPVYIFFFIYFLFFVCIFDRSYFYLSQNIILQRSSLRALQLSLISGYRTLMMASTSIQDYNLMSWPKNREFKFIQIHSVIPRGYPDVMLFQVINIENII